MKSKKLRIFTYVILATICAFSSLTYAGSALLSESDGSLPLQRKISRIETLMAEKVPMGNGDLSVEVTSIKNPVDGQFDLFSVEYKNSSGKSLGDITVAGIEAGGEYYMLQGGSVVDTREGQDLQILWRSLTEKVDLPYKPEQLLIGKPEHCRMRVSVFTDYQCKYCQTFVPDLLKEIEKDPEMCLYYIDFPLEKIHKRAKYIAKMAHAYLLMTGERVPDSIYQKDFKDDDARINQWFEKLLERKDVSITEFYKKVSSPEVTEKIDSDMELAKTLKVRGTPSIFIDGHPVQPMMETFKKVKTILEAQGSPEHKS